jgi:hypothetical protein
VNLYDAEKIDALIQQAGEFLGTDKDLRCFECIGLALEHAERIRKELHEVWEKRGKSCS